MMSVDYSHFDMIDGPVQVVKLDPVNSKQFLRFRKRLADILRRSINHPARWSRVQVDTELGGKEDFAPLLWVPLEPMLI
jgi:hypothetical protein